MLETFQTLTKNQYEAAISTLKRCVTECPDELWQAPIANRQYCQAAFHALFFADLYLGDDRDSLIEQPFHVEHHDVFRDYEELEDRKPVHSYEKRFILAYADHVRSKAIQKINVATADSLMRAAPFPWVDMPCAELHTYNIRHLQHHAAQMILKLRLDGLVEFPWHKSGWVER